MAVFEGIPQALQEVERSVKVLVLPDEVIVGADVPIDDTDFIGGKLFEPLHEIPDEAPHRVHVFRG